MVDELCAAAAECCNTRGNKIGFNESFTSYLARYLVARPSLEERVGLILSLLIYPKVKKGNCWGMLAIYEVFVSEEASCLDAGGEGGASLWPIMGNEIIITVRNLVGILLQDLNHLVGAKVVTSLMGALERLVGPLGDEESAKTPPVSLGLVGSCLAEISIDLICFHCTEPVTRFIRKLAR